jgi:hypothetical protein
MTCREAIVDGQLADLWQAEAKTADQIRRDINYIHEALGERRPRRPDWTEGEWPTTLSEAVNAARTLAGKARHDRDYDKYTQETWAAIKAEERLAAYDEDVIHAHGLRAQSQPLEAEYEAVRWSRFFLVVNANGHIHRNMHCSTTFPTTLWAWLPDLSGLTEADAVQAEGTRLCSVCFPSAPVEWTVGLPPKVDPLRCPGSGQPVKGVEREYTLRNPRTGETRKATTMDLFCPVCGQRATETRMGDTRVHRSPKVKKGS